MGQNKILAYIDGNLVISDTQGTFRNGIKHAGSNIEFNTAPRIGGDFRDNSGGLSFNGKIDDIQIWNVALDSSQVLMSSSLVRLDTSIPTLASVTLSSSNNSQNLAKPGDNLTLDFTVSEDIPQPTVNLAGHAVIPSNSSGDGKTWQAVYRVDNTTLNENVSFNIGFSDAAGNVGDNVTTVTSGAPILVDTEVPTLSNVQLVSNNTDNSSLAKAGEVITLSFSSSESIDRPSVTLGGETKLASGSGTSWTTTYEVKPGDDGIISSPLELEGLVLWLDAENVDGEKNNSLNLNSEIEKWTDLSGNGNHALPNSFGGKPSLISEDGKNFISFEESNKESLALANASQLDFGKDQDFSYVVIYKTDTVSSSYETALLSKRDGSNGYQLYLRSSNGGAPSDDAITFIGSEDENSKYFATSTESNHKDDLLHIVSSTFDKDGANVIYLDGNKKSEVLIHEIGNSSSTFPLEIGHEFYTGQTSKYFYEGEIAEIIIYDRVLDQSELAKLSYYLSKKWERTNFVNSDDDGMYDFEDPSPTGPINEPKRASFEIEFADIAGNRGVPVYETNGSKVGIDTTKPELLDVSIVSNNLDNTTARKDDQVTLSFKTTEPIQTPTSSDISITGLDTLEFNKTDTEGKQWEVSGTVLARQNATPLSASRYWTLQAIRVPRLQ